MTGKGTMYTQIFMFIERGMNDEKCRCFLFSFFIVLVCGVLFYVAEYSNRRLYDVMFQRRTKHDFETYTPVSYVTNKIHSYDAEDGVCVLVVNDRKVIKLSDAKSDTYLYKSGTSLMELCVVKDMEPDLTMGQPLMTCHDFDVEKDVNTISCKINGVTFYVNIRSEVAS